MASSSNKAEKRRKKLATLTKIALPINQKSHGKSGTNSPVKEIMKVPEADF